MESSPAIRLMLARISCQQLVRRRCLYSWQDGSTEHEEKHNVRQEVGAKEDEIECVEADRGCNKSEMDAASVPC